MKLLTPIIDANPDVDVTALQIKQKYYQLAKIEGEEAKPNHLTGIVEKTFVNKHDFNQNFWDHNRAIEKANNLSRKQ